MEFNGDFEGDFEWNLKVLLRDIEWSVLR